MTLIIIVLFMSGSVDGGVHTSIKEIKFSSVQICELAAKNIKENSAMQPPQGHWWARGSYEIKTYCV